MLIKPVTSFNIAKNSAASFSGLGKTMSKHIVPKEVSRDEIEKKGPKGARVGELPKEMITAIKGVAAPDEVRSMANKTMDTIVQASKILREIDSKPVDVSEIMSGYIDLIAKGEDAAVERIEKRIQKGIVLPSLKYVNEYTQKAQDFLTQEFSKTGIVPEGSQVKIKYMEQGVFGRAYKMSVEDEAGEKVFKDKIIKVYKDFEVKDQILKGVVSDSRRYFSEEYPRKIANISKEYPGLACERIDAISSKCFRMQMQLLGLGNNPLNQKNFDMFFSKMHGAHAEANTALFLQKSIGQKMQNSNLVEPHFFDIASKMGVFEFVRDDLKQPTKNKDLANFGLKNNDFISSNTLNPENFIAGRLIDYGGIVIENEVLANNKVARRAYKKVLNTLENSNIEQAQTVWRHYFDKANAGMLAQSEDVLLGLEEARKLIGY